MKLAFLQAVVVSVLLYSCTTGHANETHVDKARWELNKNAACCFEQILEAPPARGLQVSNILVIGKSNSYYIWA